MKAILEGIVALCVLVGMLVGAHAYFAKAQDLKLVEFRLEQKIINDQGNYIQQRMWALEDRNGGPNCATWRNARDREEYRRLLLELKKIQERRKQLVK
jgi:hypothetical protein